MATTFTSIVEKILRVFPDKTESEIVMDLDRVQKRLCNKTGGYKVTKKWTSFPLTMPTDFIRHIRTVLLDSEGRELDPELIGVAGYKIEEKKLVLLNADMSEATEMPSDTASINMQYVARPASLTTGSTTIALSEEMLEALEAGVLDYYYAMVNNWNAANYHATRYKERERDLIKEANYDGDTNYTIKPEYF